LSLLDRTRADRLRRALRCFDTKTGPYSEPSDKDQYRRFVQEVETIRLDWERNRKALVRRSFLQRTDGILDQAQAMELAVCQALIGFPITYRDRARLRSDETGWLATETVGFHLRT
jgi:hypothetical protein